MKRRAAALRHGCGGDKGGGRRKGRWTCIVGMGTGLRVWVVTKTQRRGWTRVAVLRHSSRGVRRQRYERAAEIIELGSVGGQNEWTEPGSAATFLELSKEMGETKGRIERVEGGG